MSTRVGLLLAVVSCAAIDTRLTWSARDYRVPAAELPLEALIAWACLALIVALPAIWLGRRLRAPASMAFVCLAAPVALHQVVRDPLRRGELLTGETLLAIGAVLLGLALVAVLGTAAERRLASAGRTRLLGWALLLAALIAFLPAFTGGGATRDVLDSRRAAPEGRPNLLLLVWDTTRADRLSPYGYDAQLTPHLARLAEEGAVYETAWSSSLFTLSSHTSLLTGLPPALHGTTLRSQRVTRPTLATMLKKAGYRTGAFVGTSVLTGGRGLETDFDVYDDMVDPAVCDTAVWALVKDVQSALARVNPAFRGNGLPHWFNDFQRPAAEVLAHALDFVRADDSRPWFVMINLFDVHWPYLPGDAAQERWVSPYEGPLDGYLFRSNEYEKGYRPSATDQDYIGDLYAAEMWELDAAVDRFLKHVDIERDDVHIVMTSDHGEGLGEGGMWSHDEFVGPQTNVPLIVYAPGRVPAGRRVTAHVSGTDVAPTLLDLAGVRPGQDVPIAGASLVDEPPPADRIVFVQDYDNPHPIRDGDAVIRGDFKFVRRGEHRGLFHVYDDPLNQLDITAEHPEVVAELEAELDTLLEARAAQEEGMDNTDALRALGYLGGEDDEGR